MQFVIKQKFFKIWRESFYIYNQSGEKVLQVKPKLALQSKYEVRDMQEKTVMTIKEKLFKILPRYYIYDAEEKQVAFVRKKFTAFTHKYEVDYFQPDKKYEIQGNFLAWDFNILLNGNTIGTVSQNVLSSLIRDSYVINVLDDKEALMCLAIAIIIDNVHHKEKN